MSPIRFASALLMPAFLLLQAPAQAQTETILQQFSFFPEGVSPCGTLSIDSAGDLYGTTLLGGATDNGAVFERTASGSYRVIYSFQGGSDGSQPNAGVTKDSGGNLYGTTTYGGADGKGTIYKITPSGEETVLYSFTGGADGADIYAGVAVDSAGNLYGTAYAGGSDNYGVVWEFSAAGQFTVLHNFTGTTTDGKNPYSGVILDAQGNLYGTTSLGGASYLGTVYKLSPAGQITLLHSFTTEQTEPEAGLTMDSAGNFYGVVLGAVFEITPGGKYTQINISSNATSYVAGNVALDGLGNLYFATNGQATGHLQYGVVFKVNLSTKEASVVYRFQGPPSDGEPVDGGVCPQGSRAAPGVVADASGNIYGSSQYIGLSGAIFEISSAGQESTLYNFPPSPGGYSPTKIVWEPTGVIVGEAGQGGKYNGGVLFDLVSGKERVLPFAIGAMSGNFGLDAEGNLYVCAGTGTALDAIYKVTPAGTSTLLYTFTDGGGCYGLAADAEGDLYGAGGNGDQGGAGGIFRLSASGEFTSLYIFSGGSDGSTPNAQLTLDREGNVYGTTGYGGTGGGVIFRISPSGIETVLHDFVSESGALTLAGITFDSAGNIYGAATNNGPNDDGTIYELSTSGEFVVLYAFTGGEDGYSPETGVSLDNAGNIYGTTSFGGDSSCPVVTAGCGVVFEITSAGNYIVLHTFIGSPNDGAGPASAPVLDAAGNVYGSTRYGGQSDYGAIYKIAPAPAAP